MISGSPSHEYAPNEYLNTEYKELELDVETPFEAYHLT